MGVPCRCSRRSWLRPLGRALSLCPVISTLTLPYSGHITGGTSSRARERCAKASFMDTRLALLSTGPHGCLLLTVQRTSLKLWFGLRIAPKSAQRSIVHQCFSSDIVPLPPCFFTLPHFNNVPPFCSGIRGNGSS